MAVSPGPAVSPGGVVAAVQVTSTADKEHKLAAVLGAGAARGGARGARAVFLPEGFDFIGDSPQHSLQLAEPLDGDIVGRYRQLARYGDTGDIMGTSWGHWGHRGDIGDIVGRYRQLARYGDTGDIVGTLGTSWGHWGHRGDIMGTSWGATASWHGTGTPGTLGTLGASWGHWGHRGDIGDIVGRYRQLARYGDTGDIGDIVGTLWGATASWHGTGTLGTLGTSWGHRGALPPAGTVRGHWGHWGHHGDIVGRYRQLARYGDTGDIVGTLGTSWDIVGHYRQLARECDVWLSLGGFHERAQDWDSTGRIYNCHLLLDNSGALVAAYRKLHLFDAALPGAPALCESSFTNPGRELLPPVPTPVGKVGLAVCYDLRVPNVPNVPMSQVGLAVCYDLRFPELSQALREAGAQILTFPRPSPSPRELHTGSVPVSLQMLLCARAIECHAHVTQCPLNVPMSPQVLLGARAIECHAHVTECPLSVPLSLSVPSVSLQVLLRARAIECQCYVVAAAQTGRHSAGRASFGHSLVADPWGTVVAQCQEGPGLCLAHIDLPYLEQVRRQLPVRGHRRGDIFGGTPGTPGREGALWEPAQGPGTARSEPDPNPL
ncbi:hypothetical protein DUI87_29681 [Hirundo rustica rustica]|uniref:CN hydrolase domain-containing protein n=1 Tax=Hirundo rustica rustica TaxID=333673 RepID=A0A3M0IZB5_HIRRU|nr:hypothetical protein DUI87_29681 [Hirundo rustica rustica]